MTDDPFAVLGLPRDAGEKDIRRAYARLVRKYRPDRMPEEFQRVHEAYEAALAWCAEPDEPTTDGDPLDADHGPVPGVWSLVEAGDLDEARRTLERNGGGPALTQRFLLEEMHGAPFDKAAGWLVRALDRGMAGWIHDALTDDERRRFVRRDDVSWKILGPVLFGLRIEELLLAGRLNDAVQEVWARPYRRAAESAAEWREVAMKVACAAVWDGPDAAVMVHAHNARDDEHEWLEEQYDARRRLRGEWRKCGAREVPALARLLRWAGIVDDERLRAGPWDWKGVYRVFHRMSDEFLYFVLAAVADFDGDEDENEERYRAARSRSRIARFMDAADTELEADWGNRILSFAFLVGIAVSIAGFFFGLWIGLAILVVLWPTLFYAMGWEDRRLYRTIVRPRLLELVTSRAIAPRHIASIMKRHTKTTDDIGRFIDEIEEDFEMEVLYRTVAFSRGRAAAGDR